ncbi:cytochrome-c peroxidase [Alkalimarinus sediminis]|uniref:Cytochrome c domain-containing protein n=1 Tax=Alkalimarinus sediminis TaxID=1632866 RepID=A0A9E8HLM3_9ALTE|nr:cytochrome c peroxidase [Alkalimarinus sediminis]UZW76903.1 hypothetical protein NNL22_01600 [Alkalimarinus sediminis]
MRIGTLFISLALFLNSHVLSADPVEDESQISSIEKLGEALFFDVDLSQNRTQACATCHMPSAGFADMRANVVNGAVSLGDDGKSLGDRNAPTASYARFSPLFHKNSEGQYVGGQFLDGREADLKGQAGGPPLNPIEMGMPDKPAVVARLLEKPEYEKAFKQFYGEDIFVDVDKIYDALTESIAAFEKTDQFAPFDSKYDRYLRGEYQLTPQEDLGMTLFFSQQFTNCNLCHQLKRQPAAQQETFSNYQYHNIGVPVNSAVRAVNGVAADYVDEGLLNNPQVDDVKERGKFKVPTLRNVAVTGPYMHNGVFSDLETVVLFYNKYNSRSAKRQINPETGEAWKAPEIADNISLEELKTGPALDDKRVDALVAFMRLLTDKKYEYLLDRGK